MSVKTTGVGDNGKAVGKAYRMVWDCPVELRQVNVPFDFKDLPLPRQ
jgi:hypothetical protein